MGRGKRKREREKRGGMRDGTGEGADGQGGYELSFVPAVCILVVSVSIKLPK